MRNKKKPDESLGSKVVRGGIWVFSLRILEKGLGFVRLIILARLLSPDDFGLFGIALLTISTLETFSQTGFQTALIQKKGNITDYLDTAWTVSVIRSALIFAVMFFSAPYVAFFFNTPEASPVIRVIGASILLRGLTNIKVVYFQKDLEFNKQFLYKLSISAVDFVVVVVSALILENVWALVLGLIAGGIAGLLTSYLIDPYRPAFRLNMEKARELFHFGKWVFGSSMLVFLVTQGDDALVGKFLGITALGFYQMAYKISNLPTTEIAHVISQVTFPAYAKMQENIKRLKESYLKVLQLTSFLSFMAAFLIFILSEDFTLLILGDKWSPVVPAIKILAFAGLLRAIASTTGPVFQALGLPEIGTKWQAVRFIVMLVFIYPLTVRFGIPGTSFVVLASIFISALGFSFEAIRLTKCRIKEFMKVVFFPFLCGLVMIFALYLLKNLFEVNNILDLFKFSVFGIAVFIIMAYVFDKLFNYKMFFLIQNSINAIRGIRS